MGLEVNIYFESTSLNLRLEAFEMQITHNLNNMAREAGLYTPIWRPYGLVDSYQNLKASVLIPHLQKGLKALVEDPEKFKVYENPNGYGTYHELVDFTEAYLEACKEWPDGKVGAYG